MKLHDPMIRKPYLPWMAAGVLVLSVASTFVFWLMTKGNEPSRLPGRILLYGALLSILLTWIAQKHSRLQQEILQRSQVEEALRQSQERFAGILEISAAAVISTDQEQRIVLFNQAAETMFGYSADEAIGQPLDILIPEAWRAAHRQHIRHFAESGQKNLLMSKRSPVGGLRKDGTWFPMAASISQLESGGEKIFTVLCEDITHQVQADAALRKAHDELEARVLERTEDLLNANRALQTEIAERKLAEQEVRELSGRVMRVQDEERRHLARELHDGATQNLVGAAMNLCWVREATTHDVETLQRVKESLHLIEECTNELRTISYLLHPPLLEEFGVAHILSGYVEGFSKRSGIKATLTIGQNFERLNFEAELAIFRIVQEALSNIHRHSHSAVASIVLSKQGDAAVLEIMDQGKGIAPGVENNGVGIAGMKERARLLKGELQVTSDSSGARIRAVLPAHRNG